MARRRSKRTPDEIRAWHQTMAGVARKVKAMSPAEREALAERLGIVTCEGHALSFYNMCFLYCQAGDGQMIPTMIGGFRQWQKVGRMVIKGQHATGYIYVPIGIRKAAEDEDPEDTEGQEPESVHFRLVPVFDVTQTEEKEPVAQAKLFTTSV